uniref:Uncharacterized protein n=1 Tax=Anguilla anguilla TaxID=7936 RepID=A0A0E9RLU6_ANGAN
MFQLSLYSSPHCTMESPLQHICCISAFMYIKPPTARCKIVNMI